MDFYLLPIVVNDRRELNLQLEKEINSDILLSYLIEVRNDVNFSVLGFDDTSLVRSFVLKEKDINPDELTLRPILENNRLILNISPKFKQKDKPSENKEEEKVLTYDDLDSVEIAAEKEEKIKNNADNNVLREKIGVLGNTVALYLNRYGNGSLTITGEVVGDFNDLTKDDFPDLEVYIELDNSKYKFTNSLNLSFVHPSQYLGIALDFGSESSQLAVKRYQGAPFYQEKRPEQENLFKNIHSYHKYKGWVVDTEGLKFYQEEYPTNFYKSIFFLKQSLDESFKVNDNEVFIKNTKDYLKMLVSSSDKDGYYALSQQKFHQLPNLKITHKYSNAIEGIDFSVNRNNFDVHVSLDEVKDKTYNSILKIMIASFLTNEFHKYENERRKIRFILLIPNIYDHVDLRNTQVALNSIFKDLSENEFKDKIAAWEILTVSESDASFLGYIDQSDSGVQKNADYIIVDAGKGTTDFSVIKTGSQNVFNIKPVYRNGFAGGGNLMTYAVFETVLHYIRVHSEKRHIAVRFIKDEILANLNDANLEIKNQFYQELERLKFNFSNNNQYVYNQWINAKTGDFDFRNITDTGSNIQTLIELLRQIENISDFYGYFKESCNLIAELVASNLKLVIDHSEHFNCRGVILTGRGFMFKMFEEELKSVLAQKLKIKESLMITLGDNDLKEVCIRGVFNNTIRLNTERIGYPIQMFTRSAQPTEELPPPAPKAAKKSFSNRLLGIFLNELDEIESSGVVFTAEDNLNIENLANSRILIGSKRFKIGRADFYDHLNVDEQIDIVFTPKGYFVRRLKDGLVKQIVPLAEIFNDSKQELSMVVPSLFPNYMEENRIYSLKRDDIKFAPILPPPPPKNTGPIIPDLPKEDEDTHTPPPFPKRPKFF